jgi:phage baseplate assembly protein gpV
VREKRIKGVRSWITPSLHEQLELFVAEQGEVVSMSDYLFEVIERHVEVEKAMRKSSFKIWRKSGRLAG